jgi:hypothetical protein
MTNIISTNDNPYFVGLGVPQDQGYVYVERDADIEVCKKLEKGELVFIFNARKAGKSSLRDNVIKKLKIKGYKCPVFDVSAYESSVTEKGFYKAFMKYIIDQLEPKKIDCDKWIEQKQEGDYPNTTILQFFFDYILSEFQENIIVFIEEIDSVKKFNKFSTEGFFSWVRTLYDPHQRYKYSRLNFCLLGVAKVSELMGNAQTTSFNFGNPVELTDFQLTPEGEIPESLNVLNTLQLRKLVSNPDAVLKIVLEKTGGQPYLTMKLLHKIVEFKEEIKLGEEEKQISDLVKKYITNQDDENWDEHDYFGYIKRRIMIQKKDKKELEDEQKTSQILILYKRILEKEEEIKWNRRIDIQLDLYLSGLVSKKQGLLKPTSPIHEEIFDLAWINECSDKIRPLRYQEKKTGWETSHIDPSKRDKFYLLYGGELKDAEQKYKGLSVEDDAFIDKSNQCFNQDIGGLIHSRFAIEQQKEIIINRMRYWTNYDKEIFDQLMSILTDKDIPDLSIDEEDDWFDNLIQEHIIIPWNNINILSKIDKAIQDQEENKRFDLLVTYGKILKEKIVFAENNQEQKFLLDTGLVKKRYSKDGYYIEVSNPIYWFIFNEVYINKMLPNTRGYGKKLGMWLITQDAQHLLSVEQVDNIIDSLADQDLLEDENRFLIESQLNSI